MLTVSLCLIPPQPAFASIHFDFSLPKHLERILSNKQIIESAKSFLNTTPEKVCKAYFDNLNGIDNSTWAAIEEGVTSTFTITQAIISASSAGAGALAGYAGIASAVSHLGLGWLTTAIAGMMGSSVTGAAATAVVTSVVGGPVVMGALLAGGTAGAAFGTYELSKLTVEHFRNWTETHCNKVDAQ